MTALRMGAAGAPPAVFARSAGGIAQVLPLAIAIYAFLILPAETRINLGGNFIPWFRMAIIASLPLIAARYLTGVVRFGVPDWLILIASGWMLLSFSTIYGFAEGTRRSVALILDFAGAYYLGRVSITSPNALRRLLVIVAPGIGFAGAIMMIESVTHVLFYRPAFVSIFGPLEAYQGGVESGKLTYSEGDKRLGLVRAFGPFSHPILGASILVPLTALLIKSSLRGWPLYVGILGALMGVFGISSAGFLALALVIVLIAADRLLPRLKAVSWPLVTVGIVAMVAALQMISKNGVASIVARYTLDPQTGFYRILIWKYGTATVANHPWLGIGFNVYERPAWMSASIDAHFLNIAVRFGVPVALLLAAVSIIAMIAVGKAAPRMSAPDRHLLVGFNFMLVILVLLSFTVAFFGEAQIWFMTMIGVAISLASAVPRPAASGGVSPAPPIGPAG